MKKVILDVDVGIDDFLALLLLLHHEKSSKIKILAIICTNGNTTVDNVIKNVVRILEMVKRTDIPVYKGAFRSFLPPTKPAIFYHGKDGLADLKHDNEPDVSIVKTTPAPVALRDILKENSKEISYICLGPLTTLATSLMLYENLSEYIEDIWIMGGNYMGVGNVTASAEFNFYTDPEAVSIVFENASCPIYLFPWETCLKSTLTYQWRNNALDESKPIFDLLTRAEKKTYNKTGFPYYVPCDALAVFAFLNPKSHIKKMSAHHASIELFGSNTRGQVVLDNLKQKNVNVTIIEEFDNELFKKLLEQMSDSFPN